MTAKKERFNLALYRQAMRIVVWFIVLGALYYFGASVLHHWSEISNWNPGVLGWSAVLVVVLLYSLALVLLAEVWHNLVHGVQPLRFPRAVTHHSYSKSQIAKYLPGNVFNFIGRHIIMKQSDVSHSALVMATLSEIGILVYSASIILALGIGFLPDTINLGIELGVVWFLSWVCVVGGPIVWFAAKKLNFIPTPPPFKTVVVCVCYTLVFFLVMGAVFLAIVMLVTGKAMAPLIVIAVCSWLFGFLTPGAPAGLGIREVTLLIFLRTELSEADALLAIGLFRITTTLADFVYFCAGELFYPKGAKH